MSETAQTDWARDLGLTAPLVCAPMGGVAGGVLASAVSRAGALGMIGMGSAGSAAALERELARLDTGGAPFGIGLVDWGIARDPDMFERALAAGAALVSVSFGDWEGADPPPSWIEAVRASGALAVTQVATAEEARRAADAGVDAVVARGLEGGGHGDHREPRDALLAEVLSAVEVPVLAAGAVSGPEELRRVLDAGAAAAWVGTAFAACTEALTADAARDALLAADGTQTLVSRVLDVALERPWPSRFPERLLRTPFVECWHGREAELAADAEARAEFRAAVAAADYATVPLDAGQGVGALTAVRTAAEVVAELAGPR
ncbi:NAD(P)H-dependent flavin oxidoreductase [Leucobacter massiliensis]|uniref:2-nitropropane dioxygenase n=1 Tax=Leucobacter massiliensis TaxID=1686285 RepID=A0A2S9QKH1_9MICO|nr:nitronate monooxygenase [Leucobacter massiliensis]PRI10083.1 2-nitropropane dioxygenase [Leucobacter massiliensis]